MSTSASRSPSTQPSQFKPSPPRNPLILILGPTGTGKSALALSIFPPPSILTPTTTTNPSSSSNQHTRHEIINSDAMQMYASLPIITNKLPPSTRQSIPHHLLDFIPLSSTPWTAHKFVRESSRVISDIHARGKIPVMVGGTGYYAFGALFRDSMLGDDGDGNEGMSDGVKTEFGEGEEELEILNGSTEEMLEKLKEVDPEMARSWHPRDRRKIQRSLEICLRRGRRVSEIYQEQVFRGKEGVMKNGGEEEGDLDRILEEDDRSGGARYGAPGTLHYDALIFWLSASDLPLKARLNARVDKMVEDGLFEEALELARLSSSHHTKDSSELSKNTIDKSKGIWVSIGYKELEPWAMKHLESPEKYPKDGKLARDCIEAVKAGTRQYAKRQERYIRIRLANALKQAGALDKLFLLDGTDLSRWEEDVVMPARKVVNAFLAGEKLPEASEMSALAKENFEKIAAQGKKSSYRVARYCEACEKTTMTEREWEGHIKSRSHKNVVARKRRLALVAVEGPQRDAAMAGS